MALWRFLLVFALAFGSVLPHCATATPLPAAAPHHVGMAHDHHNPVKAHVSDACIGCATPVRLAFAEPVPPVRAVIDYRVSMATLTAHPTALDPPPPRPAA